MNSIVINGNINGSIFNAGDCDIHIKGNITGSISSTFVTAKTTLTGDFIDTPAADKVTPFIVTDGQLFINGNLVRAINNAGIVGGGGYVELNGNFVGSLGDVAGFKGLITLANGTLRVKGRIHNTFDDANGNCIHKTGGMLISDKAVYVITNAGASAIFAALSQDVKTYMLATNDENYGNNLNELITGGLFVIDADVV